MKQPNINKPYFSKFHLFIANKLVQKMDFHTPLIKRRVLIDIFAGFNIPKVLRQSFINELQELGYIKNINKEIIRIFPSNIEIDLAKNSLGNLDIHNKSRISKELGISDTALTKSLRKDGRIIL